MEISERRPPAQPRRISNRIKGPEAGSRTMQINDDTAEKESRRNSSGMLPGSRGSYTSLNTVAASLSSRAKESQDSFIRENGPPLLSNFEQWVKLAKDNKINATNSWNFALIDYFHDMSLLRDGDGINFQKASYTLDGCVKIYSSRIDSVATETGKLLSGLAESGKKSLERGGDDEDDDGGEGDGEDGEPGSRQKKKRKPRAETTLVGSFAELHAKKLDIEVAADPLFRKMCADFDEGGAKGLLLNSLFIDRSGRVLFDGEIDEDFDDDDQEGEHGVQVEQQSPVSRQQDYVSLDLASIRDKYLPDLDALDSLQVCPSLESINNALRDPALLSSTIMKEIEKDGGAKGDGATSEGGPIVPEDEIENFLGGDDDGDGGFGDDDGGFDIGMGIDDLAPVGDQSYHSAVSGDMSLVGAGVAGGAGGALTSVSLYDGSYNKDLMSYFDETLKKNWAGPEHWKVQKLKAHSLLTGDGSDQQQLAKKKVPKEKEVFFIDFLSDEMEVDEQALFAPGGSSISIPKTQWKSKDRNLLPDDRHFSSKNLIQLFLKPNGNVLNLLGAFAGPTGQEVEADEQFWANQYQQGAEAAVADDGAGANNFFNDGGDGGGFGDFVDDDGGMYDDGADITNALSDIPVESGDLKGQLLLASRRARPEYVNYARTAKRVNVKFLKDNIWNALDIKMKHSDGQSAANHGTEEPTTESKDAETPSGDEPRHEYNERKFTDVVQDLKKVYPARQMQDISTSFCFICVLHLANEQGLEIQEAPTYDDLTIRQDPNAIGLDPLAV